MQLCGIFLLCVGSAALRSGTEPTDDKRTFTVTIQVSGPPFQGTILMGGVKYEGELNEDAPSVLSGRPEGESVTVNTDTDPTTCSYTVGKEKMICFLKEWRLVFKSQQDVEQTLKLNIMVDRATSDVGEPFEVKINEVTKDTGSTTQGTSWWRLMDVNTGDVVSVVFPPTRVRCIFNVIGANDKQSCDAEGWKTEFKTMLSEPYIGDWIEVAKRTNTAGWAVNIYIEGTGPQFGIFLDNERKYTEGPNTESASSIKFFDAELDQNVKFVFGEKEHYTYTVGDEKQSLQHLMGYNIEIETMPKE